MALPRLAPILLACALLVPLASAEPGTGAKIGWNDGVVMAYVTAINGVEVWYYRNATTDDQATVIVIACAGSVTVGYATCEKHRLQA